MSEEGGTEASPEGEAQSYRERYAEVDVDRGVAVGAAVGIVMFLGVQGLIVAAFQSGIIAIRCPLPSPQCPLAFSGVTQLVYVFPTALFFVNRRCPLMAKGYLAVAAAVFLLAGLVLLG